MKEKNINNEKHERDYNTSHINNAKLFAECFYQCLLINKMIKESGIEVVADMMIKTNVGIEA